MEKITKITLTTGEEVAIDTKLNIKKLLRINNDFNTDEFATLTFSRKEDFKVSILQAHQAVYIAYRMANMNNYMDFEEFTDLWEFDFQIGTQVFIQLIVAESKKTKYRDSVRAVVKKK